MDRVVEIMRYYDKVLTPLTEKTFLSSIYKEKDSSGNWFDTSVNRADASGNPLSQNHPLVSSWFNPIDKKSQERYFDEQGYPQIRNYILDSSGNKFSDYLAEPDSSGNLQPDYTAILIDTKDKKLADIEAKALEIEEQGVTIASLGGLEVDSSRVAQSRASNALSVMGRNPTASTPFKAKNGFAVADKTTLEIVQNAMWDHVDAVNINHKARYDAIHAIVDGTGTDEEKKTAISNYDFNVGW